MEKVLMPFLFIAVAVGLFFSYIRPTYDVLLALQEQEARLDETLDRSKALDERMVALTQTYNGMSEEHTTKLDQLLPPSVDTVRMVVLLDTLAKRNGVSIDTFAIPSVKPGEGEGVLAWADFSIECIAEYANVKQFLLTLERSSTLIEVTSFTVESGGKSPVRGKTVAEEGVPNYTIEFQTPFIASMN